MHVFRRQLAWVVCSWLACHLTAVVAAPILLWRVTASHDDRECEWKSDEEREPSEHEPGLVAVPDGRDRIHQYVARGIVRCKRKQNPDAQIEAVEQNIHRDHHGH